MSQRVVVAGAGLAGLSTALHLPSDVPVQVFEREDEPGGLVRSRRIGGFVFDYTGHLLHLRSDHVKEMVSRLLPDAFEQCERRAAIWSHGTFLSFPFQANLHGLPLEVVAECLTGFVDALLSDEKPEDARTFKEWSRRCFGRGIAKHFMIPYNTKLYARDLDRVTADWVSWSVPRPSLDQVVRGALGIRNDGMGYNPTFLYPRHGGIDCLARALAGEARGVELGVTIERIDLDAREVHLSDGRTVEWDRLVSTLPLKSLVAIADPLPEWAKEAAASLSAVAVVGYNFGIARENVCEHSWVYVPEPQYPFYRVGFPATFSPGAVPDGCSSAYVEVALNDAAGTDLDALERDVLDGLRHMGTLRDDDEILVRDRVVIDPAYVIFDEHRREVRDRLLDLLLEHDVQSIGRYGAWTYSSMEDAILAGKQAAEVVTGAADPTAHRAGDR